MNSNSKVKNKGVDKYVSDERAEIDKETGRVIDAVQSIGSYVYETMRCLALACQPVVDILSVRLLCNNPRNEPRKICGVIFVFDTRGDICFIYERGQDADVNDLEVIPVDGNGGTLSLRFTGPDDVMSMYWPDICVNVKDYVTGEVIVEGGAQLSMTAEDPVEENNHSFEQFRTITIHGNGNGNGNGCSAVVEYLVLTYGVFANVEVKLCGGKDEEEEEDFLVYGKISVDYNLYHSEKRVNSITLFEIKEDSRYFERTTLDSPITLSRSEVAVPTYSSLTVRVDLWSKVKNEPIVQGSFPFDTDQRAVDEIIPGLKCTNAKITVNWKQPSYQGSTPRARRPLLPAPLRYGGWKMVEVFSLFIGHQNDKDLSLYGMINFCGCSNLIIFERDKNDPYILSRGCSILPLKIFKKALVPGDFSYVSVDLEDVEGLVSIKGLVRINLKSPQKEEWYNKLLCQVVKGVENRSFAALHYTVFSHAARAILKVQCHFEFDEHSTDETCFIIYGGLVLRYGEFGIRTQYEKIYHRCVLFKRDEENPLVRFGNDFHLGLSRSVVAVPCSSSVIIEADLSFYLSSGVPAAYLRGTKEFQIGTENVTIDGDGCSLKIAVEWR